MTERGTRSRTVVSVRLLAGTAGVAAARRAVPAVVGLVLAVGLFFGPNGLHPTDVTAAVARSPRLGLGLLAAWILLLAPAARALVRTPRAAYLRSLPIGAPTWLGFVAAVLAAIELPWIVLWTLGAAPVPALAFIAAAFAGHVLLAARGAWRWPALAALAAAVLAPAPPAVLAGLGWTLAVAGVVLGWRDALERSSWRRSGRVPRRKLFAVARVLAAGVARTRGSAVARGLLLVAAGAAFAHLGVRANELAGAGLAMFVLGVGAVSVTLAVAALAGPLVEAERRARWLLDTAGVSPAVRAAAQIVVAALAGGMLGAAHGAGAGAAAGGLAAVRAAAGAGFLGAALAVIAARGARWADRAGGLDGTRVVVTAAGAAIASLMTIGWLGELGLLLIGALAALAATSSITAAERPALEPAP